MSLRRSPGLVVVALVVTLVTPRIAAADRFEVIAGWEGDTHRQGYGFLTLGVAIPAASGLVVPVRVTGSHLYYRYDSTGATVAVRSPGASAMTGLRHAGPHGSVALLGGAEVRWERREVEGSAAPVRDETVSGAVGQLEADLALAPRWRVSLLANHAGASSYTYGRAALRWQVTHPDWQRPVSLMLGIEGVGQGNDESAGFQAGPMAEWVIGPAHLSIALHAGYKDAWSPGAEHHRGAYMGAGLYHAF